MEEKNDGGKILFEEALDKTGFGLYNYMHTVLSGMVTIAMVCIVYGSTIIVPVSACELETTSAQQGLLVAAPVIGLILGGPLWGYLGDTRGRRSMLLVSLLSSAVLHVVSSLSVNWIMLMILQFICSILASAKYTLSMTLLCESVPAAKRNLVMLLVSSIFMLSQVLMAGIAIPVIPLPFSYYLSSLDIYWNSWRTLMLVYCIPALLSAFCLYFMSESPKFALLKGDEQKALDILRKIHRINNKKGAIFDVKGLLPESANRGQEVSVKEQIVPLFRAPHLKYTIILSVLFMCQLSGAFSAWLPTIANRVVRILDTETDASFTLCGILDADIDVPVDPDVVPCALNTNALLIVMLVTVVQSSINLFLTIFIVDRAGRRNVAIGITAVVGVCGILVNLVPNTLGTSILFGVFIMGVLSVGLYTTIVVAIFPTNLRAMAVATTMTAGRIAGFASIQLVNFLLFNNFCELGFYLFASIVTCSTILVALLPDDRLLRKPKPAKE